MLIFSLRKINIMILTVCGIGCLLFLASTETLAQVAKDTSPQTVTIVSAYKPQLRSVAKMNFSASGLPADTSRIVRSYRVPVNELYFGYTAVETNVQEPDRDSEPQTGRHFFVRAGYGNFSTPLLKAGIHLGDVKKLYTNFYFDHTSSKGSLPNQQWAQSGLQGFLGYHTERHEWSAMLKARMENRYLYGYAGPQTTYPKTSVQQLFREQIFQMRMRNTAENRLGIQYQPLIEWNRFVKKDSLSEQTIRIEIPFSKLISDSLLLAVTTLADITSVKTKNSGTRDTSFTNSLVVFNPSVEWKHKRLNAHLGISGISTNSEFNFLPDIRIAYQSDNSRWGILAGWTGQVQKNTNRQLAQLNPFIKTSTIQKNTVETELYGGVQTSFLRYFRFSARVGLVRYKHFQLFLLDTVPGSQGYQLSDEPAISNVRFQTNLSCELTERFSFQSQLVINGYTGLDNNARAWNTLPLEWTTAIRWQPISSLTLQADLYAFAGGQYILPDKTTGKMAGAVDVGLSGEYRFNRNWSAFIQASNIAGKAYQRWQRYPVLGTQVLGGVVFRM
ncbi:MAG: hypothetical protein ACKO5C_08495 [Ferruginibacter sp.]